MIRSALAALMLLTLCSYVGADVAGGDSVSEKKSSVEKAEPSKREVRKAKRQAEREAKRKQKQAAKAAKAAKDGKQVAKKKDRRVCKRQRVTGSRIPEKVCRKESEWARLQERARENVERTKEGRDRSVGSGAES